ncbi:hypothetical protein QP794_23440 [Paenibacillus sp. UMB7766-LJ446]|uniref:hypothetical protein n=1 Tax=Paenibacillus sp. UMB7766-LJ446 TaxID=3046313 RepID=UPI00254E9B98|nr:hypothetical protein [Paenibacillus sp. UMB7766-LJ446]MDK8193048.1 hypothetical protein [Paenibacillus sp. UMB7766-LJ446]
MNIGIVPTREYAIQLESNGNQFIIVLKDNSLPEVLEFQNGVSVGKGTYSHEALAEAIVLSNNISSHVTPLLPQGCIKFVEGSLKSYCFISVKGRNRPLYYHEAEIQDIPFPTLIMGYELLKENNGAGYIVNNVYVVTVDEEFINEDTEVFVYPYSNVGEDYQVCLGSTQLPEIQRISQLSTYPELFFNGQNTDCYYSHANESKYSFRELLEQVKGREFPSSYLKPIGMNLHEWMTSIALVI